MRELSGIDYLGCEIISADAESVVADIFSDAHQTAFSYIVTPNVAHFVRLADDVGLRAIYAGAYMRILDSKVLEIFGPFFLLPRVQHLAGSDLTLQILSHADKSGSTVSLVGGNEAILSALKQIYPKCDFIHTNPSFGFINNALEIEEICEFIRRGGSRVHLLAVGSPQQEKLAFHLSQKSEVYGVAVCVGASLEFASGAVKRAPVWLRKLGLEWAFRALSNPSRLLGRYVNDLPKITTILFRYWIRKSLIKCNINFLC